MEIVIPTKGFNHEDCHPDQGLQSRKIVIPTKGFSPRGGICGPSPRYERFSAADKPQIPRLRSG